MQLCTLEMAKVNGKPSLRCKALRSTDKSGNPQKAEGPYTPDKAVLSSPLCQETVPSPKRTYVPFHSTLKKGFSISLHGGQQSIQIRCLPKPKHFQNILPNTGFYEKLCSPAVSGRYRFSLSGTRLRRQGPGSRERVFRDEPRGQVVTLGLSKGLSGGLALSGEGISRGSPTSVLPSGVSPAFRIKPVLMRNVSLGR